MIIIARTLLYFTLHSNSPSLKIALTVDNYNDANVMQKIMHRDTVSDVVEDLARHARGVTDFVI